MKKFASLTFVLMLAITTAPSSSHAKSTDVGIVGPNGEVIFYYRDGNQIVVRHCAQNTVLADPKAAPEEQVRQARSNCQGPENRVPVEAFKRSLRGVISIENAAHMSPMTQDQVKALSSGQPPTDEQLAANHLKS